MSNRRTTLDIPLGDVPMLASALRTAICTAMMDQKPDAQRRLETYRAQLEAIIPAPARVFGGNSFAEICEALETAETFGIEFEEWGWDPGDGKGRSKGKYGRINVVIGDRKWRSHDYKNYRDGGTIEALATLLEEFSPLGVSCTRLADTEASHRRPMPAPATKESDRPTGRAGFPGGGDHDYDDYDDRGPSYGP